MKFHKHFVSYDGMKALIRGMKAEHMGLDLPWQEWYLESMKLALRPRADGAIYGPAVRQLIAEVVWLTIKKPYYNVWPGVIKCLGKLDIGTVPSESIQLPLEALAFQFASDRNSGYELGSTGLHLRSMVVHQSDGVISKQLMGAHPHFAKESGGNREWIIWMDFGEKVKLDEKIDVPDWSFRRFVLKDGMSIGECMTVYSEKLHRENVSDLEKNLRGGEELILVEEEVNKAVVSLICSCCLLADGEFVEPEVLNRDKGKEITDVMIARAQRNGRHGWHVGRELTVSPHWRNPHPALYWTGEGRKIPKIVFRKGSLVKRELAEKIPTGRMLGDDEPTI